MGETRTSKNSALTPSEGGEKRAQLHEHPQLVCASLAPAPPPRLPSHPERTDSSMNLISCPIKWQRLERHFLLELAALSNSI